MPVSDGRLSTWLDHSAARRLEKSTQRHRRSLSAEGPVEVRLNGDRLVNFSSNDYLGLANDPDLARAMAEGAGLYGVGSGASALVTGYRKPHAQLEADLADFLQVERVLLCSSGYQANLAVISSLAGRTDWIIQDKLCHASLIDGARLSGAELRRYPHLDTDGLKRQLDGDCRGHQLVITDGVFSMDGDVAPLTEIAAICTNTGAWLMVDDAHGVGVTGPGGRGSVAQAGLPSEQVQVLTGTLGKAFGCAGAFIAGSGAMVDHIVNEGRSYLFSTALSPALAHAAGHALSVIRSGDELRARLGRRIQQFRESSIGTLSGLLTSDSPIQPLVIGPADKTLQISQELQTRGFLVTAIRPPTVPEHSARLRITFSAAHTREHVDGLIAALEDVL